MKREPETRGDTRIVRRAAVIAAGHGERLRRGGVTEPKPLVPIAGVPLIERALEAVTAVGIGEIACIFNAEPASDAVEDHCRRVLADGNLRILRQTTPSSMESLFALAPLLDDGPFLLLTVDSVFGPTVIPKLMRSCAHHPHADGILGVHDFIDDENPLRVRVDSNQQITAIGARAADSPLITAGLYVFTPRIFAEIPAARAAGYTALREFLSHLCAHGYPLLAAPVAKTVDVDRPEDIAEAEQFVATLPLPPGEE